jgi:hypothetical protein
MKKLTIILATLLIIVDLFAMIELKFFTVIGYLFNPNILDFQIKEGIFLLIWFLVTIILNLLSFKFNNSKVFALLILEIFGWFFLILYSFLNW